MFHVIILLYRGEISKVLFKFMVRAVSLETGSEVAYKN